MDTSEVEIEREAARPHRSLIVVESIVGLVVGIVGLAGGNWIGRSIGQAIATPGGGFEDLILGFLGGFSGCVGGVALGIIVSARWLKRPGRPWGAVAGSLLGCVGGVGLAQELRLDQYASVLAIVSLALVGALVGFHSRAWLRFA